MGEVYRARDSRLDREVAVKVLPTAVASDPERLRRFEREGKAASSLNHPNILTVHDVGAEAGVAFLVTELLSGESLRQAVRRGPLPARRVTEIGVQLARGLAAAHERGIVHRDLKPENLFLTDDGVAKILDFGLARPVGTATADGAGEAVTLSRPEPVTAEGALLGTAGYMSPEQVRGEPADARSDLFAFGCVLHELLSGARVFARASVADTCAAILRDPPPDLAAAVPGLPPALLAVVRRCLEKRPQDRFQNARDLAFALEQATSAPGGASSEAPAARAPDRRRGRWRAVVVVAGVVAVVGASWVVRRGGHSSPPERAEPTPSDLAVAVLPFANLSGNPENEYLGDGLAEEVINVLARSNVRVVARTSAFSFKGQNLDVREIARRLGVGAVVEGSVRQAGGRLRVTAQLIRADSGFHLWSETFDRSAADVFAVEDEIARAVLGNLRPPGAAAPPAVAPRAARDPAAHELFLRGRLELRTWAADSLERAEALLEKAVAADPGFGDAWAALAETVIVRHERHQVRDREAAYAKASDAARRALASEPPSAEGHAALSHILWHERRWSVAEDEARRALALSPGSAIAHEWLAAAAIAQGRLEEAEAGFRQALALDPLSVPYHSNHGLVLNALGRYAEAASAIERGWQLRPQGSIAGATASWTAANALVRLGRLDEANRWVERTAGIPGLETYATALRARVLVGRGDHQGARAALPHAVSEVPRGDRGVTSVASACFLLGDVERGLDWLEHAGSSFRGDRLAFDRFQPEMQKVMAHPRMQAFLREANLAGLPATGPGTPPAR